MIYYLNTVITNKILVNWILVYDVITVINHCYDHVYKLSNIKYKYHTIKFHLKIQKLMIMELYYYKFNHRFIKIKT